MSDIVIVVDMQEGFRYDKMNKIIKPIAKLIETKDCIFTKFVDRPKSNFERLLNWTKFQNKPNQEIVAELNGFVKKVVTHNTYNIANKLDINHLKKFDRVITCGVYTDVCILQLALDLFDKGIKVFIQKNTIAGHPHINNSFLQTFERAIGKDRIVDNLD